MHLIPIPHLSNYEIFRGTNERIVTLKESLIEQVDKHQEAIEALEKNIIILDMFLKESSFTKASQLAPTEKIEPQKIKESVKEVQNSIPITQGKDGKVIANAFVTPEQVSIVLDDNVEISADTPPFKSFFLDRIIGEMKRKIQQMLKMEKSKENQ